MVWNKYSWKSIKKWWWRRKELNEVIQNTIEFIGYNKNDDTTYTSYNLEENLYRGYKFWFNVFKKKEKELELYKRITDKKDIDQNIKMNKIDKPFIQVELGQNDENEYSLKIRRILFGR